MLYLNLEIFFADEFFCLIKNAHVLWAEPGI
jgi:hypothetical protein